MPRTHRRQGLDRLRRQRLTASLGEKISALGGVVVIAVGLALAAIVEQGATPPAARHPVAERRPVHATHTRSRRPVPSHASPSRAPMSPAAQLSQKVEKVVLAERSPVARRDYGVGTLSAPIVRLSRMDHRRTWAFGTETIPPPRGMTAMPESSLYLAQLTGTGWQVGLAGTPQFTTLLGKAPASVVPDAERPVLAKFSDAPDTPVDTGLMLPWGIGQSWSLLATDKGVAGFDGGDGRVLAAGDGRIYRLCSSAPGHGLVLLIHPNGLATEYYQMTDVTAVRDGSLVKRGDYLGRTGTEQPCGGGAAPQRMVGFAVGDANGPTRLDRLQIGGWTLRETAAATFAERAGVRVDAGNPVLNFGVMPTPPASGSPSPSGTPKSGPPSTRVPDLLLPGGSPDARV
ncbi:M23 family metallopeptidase [Actinoallomurus purpureus]|uniref:M23 family metallopeptidase n=1 Tax=Actinoallomurus purpureus TaxID=478114 RepID=UPI0020924F4F|nr:M23 family metallopeptidase [Actinoallomurus purpureus]MCO6005106.1 M23 family metallopeptidase [Actinoallomurus purpureus]